MTYQRPAICIGDRFTATSRQYGHHHRASPFIYIADMIAYIKVENDAGDIFELKIHDWQFKKIEKKSKNRSAHRVQTGGLPRRRFEKIKEDGT